MHCGSRWARSASTRAANCFVRAPHRECKARFARKYAYAFHTIFDDVQAAAVKRALAEAVGDAMKEEKLSKVEMARRMGTS